MNYYDARRALDYFFIHSRDREEYELFLQIIMSFFVKPGDSVADVGANHGFHTACMKNLVGPGGKVWAFEALPHLAAKLSVDYAGDQSVNVIAKVLTKPGQSDKTRFCQVFGNDDAFSGIRQRWDVDESKKYTFVMLPQSTLDNEIPESENISFIKVDVEGADFDVLRGARRILLQSRPIVVFEYANDAAAQLYDYSHKEFYDFFNDTGYQLFRFYGGKYEEQSETFWMLWAVPKENAAAMQFFEHGITAAACSFAKAFEPDI
ncbi:MAG: FkbM family methyltransferase [Rickettsiales bacterium]|jgi:FkbM family methyltransferase|nr:FkbM family methyltransferase [Rickettsiales bacterium]